MAAGLAAVGREVKETPQKRERRVNVFSRDALQFRIAAERAVGVQRLVERHEPGIKACLALAASPRKYTDPAKEVIHSELPTRTSGVLRFADRAGHLGTAEPFQLPKHRARGGGRQ